mmetsp:Transcript_43677/g.130938  ORF Transcript_43677/g.130938 Transcript_43677/m.130938 type:complete len:200 (-) Transcript_43677:431-1030(-)
MAPLPLGFAPPSLYHVLGVDDDASDEQLRAAYRRLCLRLHPDKSNATGQAEAAVAAARGVDHGGCEGGGTSCAGADPPLAPEASARFHEVQRAYEVLRDPRLREVHDRERMLAAQRAVLSFQDELDLDEMDECKEAESYMYDCRCGDVYVLPKRELLAVTANIALPCATCSNHILVRCNTEAADAAKRQQHRGGTAAHG